MCIRDRCVRQLNGEVDESEIQNIMRYVRSDIDDEYFAIIKVEIEDFVDKKLLMNRLPLLQNESGQQADNRLYFH